MDKKIITLNIKLKAMRLDMLSPAASLNIRFKEIKKELKLKFGDDFETWYNYEVIDIINEQNYAYRELDCYVKLEITKNKEMLELMEEVEERLKVGL